MTAPAVRRSPLALTVLSLLHHRPLHPYGIQRLLKDWGKDRVVNVGQRTGLYRTIERLHAAGLVTVRQTARDQAYPERTVYALTDAGRATAQRWMDEMLAAPRNEFPEFPAALSLLLVVTPEAARSALERRADALARRRSELEDGLTGERRDGLPRVVVIEDEYLLAMVDAEERWIRALVGDLREGRLGWSPPAVRPSDADGGNPDDGDADGGDADGGGLGGGGSGGGDVGDGGPGGAASDDGGSGGGRPGGGPSGGGASDGGTYGRAGAAPG